MKKHFLLLFFLSAITITIGGCFDDDDSGINIIELNEADNGRTIEMNITDQIKIDLTSNPSTGYHWENVLTEGSFIIQIDDAVFTEDDSCAGFDGCGGIETLIFKGTRTGEGAIKLYYHISFEEDPEDQFEIIVITY